MIRGNKCFRNCCTGKEHCRISIIQEIYGLSFKYTFSFIYSTLFFHRFNMLNKDLASPACWKDLFIVRQLQHFRNHKKTEADWYVNNVLLILYWIKSQHDMLYLDEFKLVLGKSDTSEYSYNKRMWAIFQIRKIRSCIVRKYFYLCNNRVLEMWKLVWITSLERMHERVKIISTNWCKLK